MLPNFIPGHALTCHITHNPHKLVNMNVEEWVEDEWRDQAKNVFVSDEERERAIATDSLWAVFWFDEPRVNKSVVASSLEALAAYCEQEKIAVYRE